jgi:hypothetical protein
LDELPPLHINFPLSEIASPTKDNDPESTEFARDWQKTILLKSFRKIDKQLARRKLLTNNHHFDKLKSMLNYPHIDKKTFNEHFMLSIPCTNAGIPMEIYPSQFLKTIRDFYIGQCPGGIIHIHLELTGLPYTLLEDAFLMSPLSLKHDAEPTSSTSTSPTTSVPVSPNANLVTPSQGVSSSTQRDDNANDNAHDSHIDSSQGVQPGLHADVPADNTAIQNHNDGDAAVSNSSDPPTAAVALHPAFQRVSGIQLLTPITVL